MPRLAAATLVGSGPSSGVPIVECFVRPREGVTCARCLAGVNDPCSVNNRTNPSMLLTIVASDGDGREREQPARQVLVDCGKTMRAALLKVLLPRGVRRLDGLIITHDHADAYLGLLELAPLLPADALVPLFTDAKTLRCLDRVFPGVVAHENAPSSPPPPPQPACDVDADGSLLAPAPPRPVPVPRFAARPVTEGTIFQIGGGVDVLPLYVEHGDGGYMCLAFVVPLGADGRLADGCDVLVYMSDVRRVPDEARAAVLRYRRRVLVLDLLRDAQYVSHFGFAEAVEEAGRIGAERTVFIGTSHSVDRAARTRDLRAAGNDSCSFGNDGDVLFSMQ